MIQKTIPAAAFSLLLLTSGAFGQTVAPSPAASPEAPTFSSEIEVVTVDVVVTDKKGVSVSGLKESDFQVMEDDKPQTIASFEAVQVPDAAPPVAPQKPRISVNTNPEARTGRSFLILFDDIHLTPQQAHRAKIAVGEFLKTGTREGDRVTLVATGGSAFWSTRMAAGRDELIGLVKRLDGRLIPDMSPERMSDHEAMRIHVYRDQQTEERVSRRFETYGTRGNSQQSQDLYSGGDPYVRGRASDVYFQSVSRNRITLEVLERALLSLAPVRGRKSVILVSQGFIYDPNLDEFKKVVQASRRANAAMYFLDTRGLGGLASFQSAEFGPAIDNQDIGAAFIETLEEAAGAESLAADSGGFTVKNTNDLSKGIGRIAEDSRSYYLLGYNPVDQKRDGRFRKIQVRLKDGKGLKIRARKGYYAPGVAKGPAPRPGIDAEIQAALDSPYEERRIPIRMTSYVFDETLLGKANVLVVADVDVREFAFKEQDGRFMDTLEFLMVVAHRESGEYFRYDQKVDMKLLPATREKLGKTWMALVRDFELAAGGYQAKIVVRDQNNRAIGTLVHEFEVPDLATLRVSTPHLSDVLQPDLDKKGPGRVPMLARRTFAPTAMIFAQFEVYGAQRDKATNLPRVAAGYQIVKRDGRVIAVQPPTRIQPTSLGKLSRMVGAAMEGAGEGDYEVVVTVTDEVAGKTVVVREPFTISSAAPPTIF